MGMACKNLSAKLDFSQMHPSNLDLIMNAKRFTRFFASMGFFIINATVVMMAVIHFANAVVTILFGQLAALSSASWSLLSPPLNFGKRAHVNNMIHFLLMTAVAEV